MNDQSIIENSSCLVQQAAEKFGDLAAVIDRDRTISFVELNNAVSSTVINLERKISKGELIALISSSSIESIIMLHALLRIGAIACPLNNHNPPEKLTFMLEQVDCKKVFTDASISKQISGLEIFPIDEFVVLDSRTEKVTNKKIDYFDPATIIFTSGSSSEPKAACHSYGNHYYNALGSNENIKIDRTGRWLMSLPFFHVGGLAIIFRTLLSGAALVLPDENISLQDNIVTYKISHLSLVSTQLFRLFNEQNSAKLFSTLKSVLIGGGPLNNSLFEKAKEHDLPIFVSYGLTEMASQVTTTSQDASIDEQKSSGKILPYGEMIIDDRGEILTRGQKLFLGYYESGSIKNAVDSDGWFHTGDRGFIDANNNLHVLGRIDNMFICGGENIQPEEIENEIISIINSSNVMVVPVNDVEYGQRPVAIIDGKYNKTGLIKQLRIKLSGLKMPKEFLDWPSDLETGFKVSRATMKRYASDQLST